MSLNRRVISLAPAAMILILALMVLSAITHSVIVILLTFAVAGGVVMIGRRATMRLGLDDRADLKQFAASNMLELEEGSNLTLPKSTHFLRWGMSSKGAVVRGESPGGVSLLMGEFELSLLRSLGPPPSSSDQDSLMLVAYCEPGAERHGLKEFYCSSSMAIVTDAIRVTREQLTVGTESVMLDQCYQLAISEDDDPAELLEIFSPALIVWMNEITDEMISVEFERGCLCVRTQYATERSMEAVWQTAARIADRLN